MANLTSKEIFLRIVESLNNSGQHDSKDVVEIAKIQYKELRDIKIFNRYPRIGEKDGN